jgi:metal-responsive CopG/Arc/MetJ family transcriptional regulator
MTTVQVVLDEELLRATDRAARHCKCNRSALVRAALREHLRRLRLTDWEEQERAAYARNPQDLQEIRDWEAEAVWPAE